MKEFIEKLIGRLEEKKKYFQTFYECEGKTEEDKRLNKATQLAFDDSIDVVNQLAEKHNNGWISCKERLPEEKGEYLVCDDDGKIHESTYYHNMWLVQSTTSEILAWMPLPTPYKESEEK